jgi:(1->4)-alpha-D-glucan 1-alpha-D-glucosylmutase
MIWKTLTLRRQQPDLFRDGDYTPLTVTGSKADHVCAFARRFQAQEAFIIAPRLFARLLGGETKVQPLGEVVWQDTRLELTNGEVRRYVNVFTRETLTPETSGETLILPLARVLNYFPLALLVRS